MHLQALYERACKFTSPVPACCLMMLTASLAPLLPVPIYPHSAPEIAASTHQPKGDGAQRKGQHLCAGGGAAGGGSSAAGRPRLVAGQRDHRPRLNGQLIQALFLIMARLISAQRAT